MVLNSSTVPPSNKFFQTAPLTIKQLTMTTIKLTDKQEKFCQEIVKGSNQREAYIKAGYSADKMKDKTVRNSAYKLMQNGDILARIEELKEPLQKKFNLKLEDILLELEEARAMAIETKNSGSMVSASVAKAKLCGLEKNTLDIVGDIKNSLQIEFINKTK